jgi:hypothetical protein
MITFSCGFYLKLAARNMLIEADRSKMTAEPVTW